MNTRLQNVSKTPSLVYMDECIWKKMKPPTSHAFPAGRSTWVTWYSWCTIHCKQLLAWSSTRLLFLQIVSIETENDICYRDDFVCGQRTVWRLALLYSQFVLTPFGQRNCWQWKLSGTFVKCYHIWCVSCNVYAVFLGVEFWSLLFCGSSNSSPKQSDK